MSDRHSLDAPEILKSQRLSARVDNNAIQDGFDLYQQYFLLTDEGEWTAISQGMNKNIGVQDAITGTRLLFNHLVAAPHTGIAGIEDQIILNLVDPSAETLQQNMIELTKEKPTEIIKAMKSAEMPNRHDVEKEDINTRTTSISTRPSLQP